MTTPAVSLPLALGTAGGQKKGLPGQDAQDAFTALLAALSTGLGVPLAPLGQPVVTELPPRSTQVVAGGALASGAPALATAPAAFLATSQRAALGVGSSTVPVPPQVSGPVVPTNATAVDEEQPVPPGSAAPELLAVDDPQVPVQVADELLVDQVPVAPPDVPVLAAPAPAAAGTPPTAEAPAVEGTGPTKHVQPAVLEAVRGLRHEGGGRTSLVVRLDPPELGAVLVRLTVQDGRVEVQLRTPDLAVRGDLQAQAYDVEQVLRAQGFDLASFDVSQGDVLPGSTSGGRPDRQAHEQGRPADQGPSRTTHVMDDVPEPDGTQAAPGTWL